MKSRQKGQALVEFAMTLPLFMLLVFVTIELSLVFVSFYSETRMARETARWLAVHSVYTDDATLANHVLNTMLPGLVTGSVSGTAGTTSTPSVYTVGNMTVTFTPCVPAGGVAGAICTHQDRVAGATLFVQMSYNAAPVLFLPTTFRFGSLTTSLPTGLPFYKVSAMVE